METPLFEFACAQYPLAKANWYRIGGPARWALFPRTPREAQSAYSWMLRQPCPWLILGNGSNVLLPDAGFPGIVMFTSLLDTLEPLGEDRYQIGAGVDLMRLVHTVLVQENYEGVGALTGIPGSVGGALFMNAGTVNGSIGEMVESVELLNETGPATVPVNAGQFGYRSQTFCPPGSLILGGTFQFVKSGQDQQAIYAHYLARRREKQPAGNCCGSVFKNPPDGHAGQLIEACGLKGLRHNGAVISPMHANFIMNDDNATAADVLWLINRCKEAVRNQFGIELHEEVRIIQPEPGDDV